MNARIRARIASLGCRKKCRERVLGHVLGARRLGQHAGDGRIGEDVLQRELRPAVALELGGPRRQRHVGQALEIGAIHERPADQHGDAAVREQRQQPLRVALGDRVVDLDEIRPLALQKLFELPVERGLRGRDADVARLPLAL